MLSLSAVLLYGSCHGTVGSENVQPGSVFDGDSQSALEWALQIIKCFSVQLLVGPHSNPLAVEYVLIFLPSSSEGTEAHRGCPCLPVSCWQGVQPSPWVSELLLFLPCQVSPWGWS